MKYIIALLFIAATAHAGPWTGDIIYYGEGGQLIAPQIPTERFSNCRPDTVKSYYSMDNTDSVEVNGKIIRSRGTVNIYGTRIEWVCQ